MNYFCTFTQRVHCHVRVKETKVFPYSSKIGTLFHWLSTARICCNHFCTLQSVNINYTGLESHSSPYALWDWEWNFLCNFYSPRNLWPGQFRGLNRDLRTLCHIWNNILFIQQKSRISSLFRIDRDQHYKWSLMSLWRNFFAHICWLIT